MWKRDNQYATGEIKRGNFELIIMISLKELNNVKLMLQKYFNDLGLHVQIDGGIEFYKREIKKEIIPYLEKSNINFMVVDFPFEEQRQLKLNSNNVSIHVEKYVTTRRTKNYN